MKLYHGSKSGIVGAIAPTSRSCCDFGRGFYMGEEQRQPLTLICRADNPKLYELEFDPLGLVVRDIGSDLLWALFVAVNRGAMDAYRDTPLYAKIASVANDVDVLVGRIANDRVFQAVQFFFERIITIETLCEVLKALNLGRQYCAISQKACQNIKILSERDVGPTERDNLRLKSDMQRKRADELTEKIIDSRRRTDGLFFDEICEKYASGEGLPIC